MLPEKIDALKYAELRSLAKEVGIKANLKAEKLRSALKAYYSQSQQESERNASVDSKASLDLNPQPKSGKKHTPQRKSISQVEKNGLSAKKSTPSRQKTPQTSKGSARKANTSKKNESTVNKRKITQSPENQEVTSSKKHKRSDTCNEVKVDESEAKKPEVKDEPSEDCSPGVKEVVDSLTSDMTSQQMKDTLMQAIDKRAKEKVENNAPVPEFADTQIPRFTALGSIRTYSQKKPITPGNRDWEKIHQKEFNKMQSIDSYLVNKKQRSESLTQSMKKMRLLTQQMRCAVDSVKQYRTPPSLLKGKTKLTKPVVKSTSAAQNKSKALFQSPATKAFVPTVTSTSKANFNFTAMNKPTNTKSPAARKTPLAKSLVNNPRKSKTPNPKSPARKAPLTKPSVSNPRKSKTPTAKSPAKKKTPLTKPAVSKAQKSRTPMAKSPVAKKTPSAKPVAVKSSTSVKTPVGNVSRRTPAGKISDPDKLTKRAKQGSSAMSTPAHRLGGEPVRKSPRLSGIGALNVSQESPTISFKTSVPKSNTKENRKSVVLSAKKSSVTPFKFNSTLNKSNLNASHNSSVNKPKFDLKASLARPITWKMHTGKLQPVKYENIYSQPLNVKQATVHAKVTAKKDNRRKMEQRARADRRLDEQMRRRGIMA